MENLVEKLLIKSQEAFMMAIEVYNKPTIKYRVEGFSFFICNAWELMLKAHIVNKFGEEKIYYKDNPNRTITLENSILMIFTNNKDPLRLNLEKIIELRNTSTHFITEEYEMIYVPLFQSCVFNFIEKISEFHNIDMTEIIPQNFLSLSVSMSSINTTEIRAKYPEAIAEKIITTNQHISEIAENNNDGFAIRIEHYHYITKDKSKATSYVHIDNTAESGVKIIKELKDPNNTHKYTAKKCCEEINKRLKKLENLNLNSQNNKFNIYHFKLFCKYYDIKNNIRFCYIYNVGKTPKYSYSLQAIELIVEEIKKNPNGIISDLKTKLTKK